MCNNLSLKNEITRDDFLAVSRRCHYNEYIADFYDLMAEDNSTPIGVFEGEIVYGADINLTARANHLRACSRTWQFDFFEKSKVKSLVRVNRCKDRFCLNCQALAADQRYVQYSPLLDEYSKDYDLYHVVFTVPNVDSDKLADTVTLMLDRFSYLIRFFDGRKGIRNVNLKKYGYVGAVRSLEITVSKKDGSYHPHLHTIFILKKGMNLPQVYFNRFSIDRTGRNPLRLFSDFDMLLQRMWCLLIMKERLSKDNIEHIEKVLPQYPDGFSCRADLSNGKYHEIFKYAIKGTFKEKTLFTFEAFKTLYKALYGRRVYQTFGCLLKYDFNDYDESLGLNDVDDVFALYISKLQELELPQKVDDELTDILTSFLNNDFDIKYVSKATFVRHFKSLSEEDKLEMCEKLGGLIDKYGD